jgi:hypothetical protein
MPSPQEFSQLPNKTGALGLLIRLIWMFLGIVTMLILAMLIVKNGYPFLSPIDLAYAAVLGAALIARYVDIQYFHGSTSEGAPATMTHWKRYAILLTAVAVIGWLAAHGAALVFSHPVL